MEKYKILISPKNALLSFFLLLVQGNVVTNMDKSYCEITKIISAFCKS